MANDGSRAGRLNVFISYSRADEAFAEELMLALQDRDFDVSLDRHSIREGEAWKERLGALIADADTVVFVLSPDSVRSTVCQWEVEHAQELAKRTIPVLWRGLHELPLGRQADGMPWPPISAAAPSRLAALNYLRFDVQDDGKPRSFVSAVRRLVSALETDLDWLREHTRLLTRAREWDDGGRPVNRLLSGPDVAAAKGLLDARKPNAPPMLPLQLDFLKASEDNEAIKADAVQADLAERERLVKQAEIAHARTRWLQRRSYIVLAMMLTATLATGWQVYGFWQRVMVNRAEFIASLARDQFHNAHDKVTAQLLALEALPDTESASVAQRMLPYEGAAHLALHDAYTNYSNKTWTERKPLAGHSADVIAVFAPDGTKVLTGSKDGTARLWEAATGKPLVTLVGHTRSLSEVAFSPDSHLVMTGSADGTARLWEATSGKLVATLSHTDAVRAVAFSPDGRLALTGSSDGTARLWEVATGKTMAELSGHTSGVNAAAFSPDGRLVLTGSDDATARTWEAGTGKAVATLAGHTRSVHAIAFAPDNQLVLTGSDDGTARLWEAATGKSIANLAGHTRFVRAVAFSPDGHLVVTGSVDATARLWEVASNQQVATLAGHTAGVTDVKFSHDGKFVLTGSSDRTARIWNAVTGTEVATLAGHTSWVTSVAISRDGKSVLTGSGDRTARLWAAAPDKPVRTLTMPMSSRRPAASAPGGPSAWATSVAFSPDGTKVLTGSSDGTAHLWEAATGALLATLDRHTDEVAAVAFSSDGRRLLIGSRDGTVRQWEPGTAVLAETQFDHTGSVSAMAFSSDGRLVSTGSDDGTARLWDAATGKSVATFAGHRGRVNSVAVSSDGRLVLTGSNDGSARVWEAGTGKAVAVLDDGHTSLVGGVAFSPDNRRAVIGTQEARARLWDTKTGKPTTTLVGHKSTIWAVAFSPDGPMVLTGSFDNSAHLWDAATGKLLATLDGHTDSVIALVFSPDGKMVLTGSQDGTARLWEVLPTQSLIREVKSKLPRCLTSDQRQRFHLAMQPPHWCYTMKLWPYDDPSITAWPPPTIWDERLARIWDVLASWGPKRNN